MSNRRGLYIFLSVLALLGVALMFYFFIRASMSSGFAAAAFYRDALWSILAGVACIELRIRTTHRLPKTALFWMHLTTAIPFAVVLGILGYLTQPLWLVYLSVPLCLGTLVFGVPLFVRGLRQTVGNEVRQVL